ncbi:hypothetical protein HMN09_00910800 [Mycena chlorophos]|uniref:Uncharacterized protein n=1 Tax=Mycena chlorophos TaxID=658473 RepID=A0A8H6SN89_MYCCL|nr:hypothetical protein HMN09_00910800 [Mycena chlorophos]
MQRCAATRVFLRRNSSLAGQEGDATSTKLAALFAARNARRAEGIVSEAVADGSPTPNADFPDSPVLEKPPRLETLPVAPLGRPPLGSTLLPAGSTGSGVAFGSTSPSAGSTSVEARRQMLLARRAEREARERQSSPSAQQGGFKTNFRPFSAPNGLRPPSKATTTNNGSNNNPGAHSSGFIMRPGTGNNQRGSQQQQKARRRNRDPSRRNERDWEADLGETEDGDPILFSAELDAWIDDETLPQAKHRGPDIRLPKTVLPPETPLATVEHSDRRSVLQKVAGDYSQFVPTNPQVYIAAAKKLGPVKHSNMAVSHQRDVPTENRLRVQNVVGTVSKVNSKIAAAV